MSVFDDIIKKLEAIKKTGAESEDVLESLVNTLKRLGSTEAAFTDLRDQAKISPAAGSLMRESLPEHISDLISFRTSLVNTQTKVPNSALAPNNDLYRDIIELSKTIDF